MNKSEYQEKYCGARGGRGGAGGGGGGGSKGGQATEIAPVKAPEDVQPVGGRSQARARAAAQGLPAYDESFVATVYSANEQGTHRIQPGWRDPRWSNPTRAGASTLYETAERDPAHRQQFYVYKTTLIDPLETPCLPMPAPDVHKLRYMHNNYMTPDDWY